MPGIILKRKDPVSHVVQMNVGQMQQKHVDHIRDVFAPPAVITSDVATGPSTVECTSTAVTQGNAGNTVPDANSFEELMTSTLVTEQHEVPHPTNAGRVFSAQQS